MRRFAIRLALVLAVLLIASQFLIPPYLERRAADRLTAHGGSAHVDLGTFPAIALIFGDGGHLDVTASHLSVDLSSDQRDVFRQLDDFSSANVTVTASRAGPFTISRFSVRRAGDHLYDVTVAGDGTAADVATYAGSHLAGDFGQALAALATSALAGFDRPIPFGARMQIATSSGDPVARNVVGDVDGLPAGPLAQVVANALLSGL